MQLHIIKEISLAAMISTIGRIDSIFIGNLIKILYVLITIHDKDFVKIVTNCSSIIIENQTGSIGLIRKKNQTWVVVWSSSLNGLVLHAKKFDKGLLFKNESLVSLIKIYQVLPLTTRIFEILFHQLCLINKLLSASNPQVLLM